MIAPRAIVLPIDFSNKTRETNFDRWHIFEIPLLQNRAASGGRVGATAAVYSAAILGTYRFLDQ